MQSIPVYDVKLVRSRTPLRLAESALRHGEDAARVLHALIGASDREQFVCVFLNARHEITGLHVAAIGGQSMIGTIDPRCILRAALAACAAAMIVGHNHPSGDPRPSEDDIKTTARLCKAAHAVGVPIIDHVIVTREAGRDYSFFQQGNLLPSADA